MPDFPDGYTEVYQEQPPEPWPADPNAPKIHHIPYLDATNINFVKNLTNGRQEIRIGGKTHFLLPGESITFNNQSPI
jgi:hypothetical protein